MVPPIDSTVKFDAFADQHDRIGRMLAEVRELLAQRRDALMVTATLGSLHVHLELHYVQEIQEDGFFDTIIEQAPWLKKRAVALIREHTLLTNALEELLSRANEGTPTEKWWNDMDARFEAFWKLFFRHEHAEIDLVQEAFNDDIGAAD
jgi:hypothetical protein